MSRPASSPRRWPDLLIGVLVALLLIGFGLLLFRPDSRPVATTGATSTDPGAAESGPAATIPAAPGTASTSPAAPDTAPPTSEPAASATDPAPESAAPESAEPPTIAAAPEIPQAPDTAPSTTPATPQDSATAEADTGESAVPAPAEAAPAASSAAPRSGGAVATSEQRTPLRSDYRITLGTFTSEQVARARTAGVSTLGYTVYPIDLGAQVVAQVGPFEDEASARQALADIQRAYPGALLYPPRNRSLSGAGSAPAGSAAPAAGSATSPAAEAAAPAPAPSGPTYLQVGAFDRVESAQRLVGQLRDLGYAPTVNAPEGRKVTVLVGPFSGDALTRTESRLSQSGLDHFRVR